MRRIPLVLIALALTSVSAALSAQSRIVVGDFSSVGADGNPSPWKLAVHAGKADISLESEGGVAALVMKCRSSSFGLEREADIDLAAYPTLSWKWKADRLPEGGDYRKAKADDQAAQLYVAFSKTQVIGYIWDTSAPKGSEGEAAGGVPFMSVKIVVLRSGKADAGRWVTESRNVLEDYRRLFGKPTATPKATPKAKGLRILINSQHTGTDAEAAFADIGFEKLSIK